MRSLEVDEIIKYCTKYLKYSKADGDLIWKLRPSPSCKLNKSACRKRKDGYTQIKIKGKYYLSHRIVWLIHYNCFPKNTIDHINRDRSDNRIENLRELSLSDNLKNSGKGYYWCKRENKFIVYYYDKLTKKRKYIGRFNSESESILKVKEVREYYFDNIT